MSHNKKRRRADGTLRPTHMRRHLREQALLAQNVKEFKRTTIYKYRLWNGQELQDRFGGVSFRQSSDRLIAMADHLGWHKCFDAKGKCWAIGKPKETREP